MWSRQPRRSAIAEAPARDRDLVRLYWPVELRPAFDALVAIDDAMAEVVASASQPTLGLIKLAWWREELEKLDGNQPPAEPRLQAAARELLPRGVSGAELAELEDGWADLLRLEEPHRIIEATRKRGPLLFALARQLLGVTAGQWVHDKGHEFALADFARRGLFDMPGQRLGRARERSPRSARPLTALWALARRDMRRGGPPFEPEATPARAWTLLQHRLTGR